MGIGARLDRRLDGLLLPLLPLAAGIGLERRRTCLSDWPSRRGSGAYGLAGDSLGVGGKTLDQRLVMIHEPRAARQRRVRAMHY